MRDVPQHLTDVWKSGDFTGDDRRPIARVTIERMKVGTISAGRDVYASYNFKQQHLPKELPNVKSVQWDRQVTTEAAECTIALYNTAPLPVGRTPPVIGELDQPGFYTFNHGTDDGPNGRWGSISTNRWQNMLLPNRIIRTYEGYGYDPTAIPERDPHLVQTGVWLIDDVEYSADGMITVKCRDAGRLLLDEICFPPVIPAARYPLTFEHFNDTTENRGGGNATGWFTPTYNNDSARVYVGGSGVYGHYGADAFDGSDSTYWLSTGNGLPSASFSYEWVEGDTGNRDVTAIDLKPWGGPYRVYVSIKINGVWQGRNVITYDPNNPSSFPNGSNIPYVEAFTIDQGERAIRSLKKTYRGVDKIRVTFTHLFNSGLGVYPYRAGVRHLKCATGVSSPTVITHHHGNYADYTDIVKMLCAWGGLHWPRDAFVTYSDGSTPNWHTTTDTRRDGSKVLGTGRAWGDFENTGTYGPAKLTVDTFDKKPLMDAVTYIRDIVGFNFYIDELGSAIFRSPNIWSVGNVRWMPDTGERVRTSSMVTIDEVETLRSLTVTLSSRNMRERIFVANTNGKLGAVAKGRDPWPSGLRRVAGWTDQHFSSHKECQIMADLISLRQLFTYRVDRATMPGYPRIQIDDQVRIVEQTTGEDFIHYVAGISSSLDMEEGKWEYTLDTHWLGASPFDDWAFNPSSLAAVTQAYLHDIGKI